MKPFTFERAQSEAQAASAVMRSPNAKFIAGADHIIRADGNIVQVGEGIGDIRK